MTPSIRARTSFVAVLALASLTVSAGGPDPPTAELIARVRANIRTDEELQDRYTYLERRRELRVSKLGKVSPGDERVFEVYPSHEPGKTYKRLVRVNGAPVPPGELRTRDEARRKWLADEAVRLANETPAERSSRERRAADEQRKRDEVVNDVFRMYSIAVSGRDQFAGSHAFVATLTPRPGVVPRSRPGRYFPKFRGKAWISEDDYQVIKVELEAIDDVLIGWGLVGRIHKGSHLTYERTRVNNEVWLPSRMRFEMIGRTVLVRKFEVEAVTDYSDYRKFEVSAREAFTLPPP